MKCLVGGPQFGWHSPSTFRFSSEWVMGRQGKEANLEAQQTTGLEAQVPVASSTQGLGRGWRAWAGAVGTAVPSGRKAVEAPL